MLAGAFGRDFFVRYWRPLAVGGVLLLVALVLRVVQTGPPLATLGGEPIHEADYRRYLQTTLPLERLAELRRDPKLSAQSLGSYLDMRAVAEKVRRIGLDKDVRFVKAVELMEVRTLARLFSEHHRGALAYPEVTQRDLETYYEQHRHEFGIEPRFTAHHLLVYIKGNPAFPEQGLSKREARVKATRALTKLRAGKSWMEVAREYSDDVPTSHRGGLLRDRQFGYFSEEVEQALRTQELGKPGDPIETVFGYYVVEVVERVTGGEHKPFAEVQQALRQRLTEERSTAAQAAFMEPIRREVHFELTAAGIKDAPLFDERAVPADEVLARIDGRPIRESEFRWFCRDALLPHQRASVDARPEARRGMLGTYLDQLVLAVRARKDGLDRSPDFRRQRTAHEEQLRLEFLREHDGFGAVRAPNESDLERAASERRYLDRIRAEVGLKLR